MGGVESGRGMGIAESLELDIRVGAAEGAKQGLVQSWDQEDPASGTKLMGAGQWLEDPFDLGAAPSSG